MCVLCETLNLRDVCGVRSEFETDINSHTHTYSHKHKETFNPLRSSSSVLGVGLRQDYRPTNKMFKTQ